MTEVIGHFIDEKGRATLAVYLRVADKLLAKAGNIVMRQIR